MKEEKMKMNQNAIDAASATTGELIVSTAREDEESQPLKLFTVTLDWNPADSAEGDYSDNVWALDEAQAIEKLATEMSEHPDASAETAEERAAFVKRVSAAIAGGENVSVVEDGACHKER